MHFLTSRADHRLAHRDTQPKISCGAPHGTGHILHEPRGWKNQCAPFRPPHGRLVTCALDVGRIYIRTAVPHLIDDDNRVGGQVGVAGDLPQEKAFGEEKDAGGSPPGRVKPHLLKIHHGQKKSATESRNPSGKRRNETPTHVRKATESKIASPNPSLSYYHTPHHNAAGYNPFLQRNGKKNCTINRRAPST